MAIQNRESLTCSVILPDTLVSPSSHQSLDLFSNTSDCIICGFIFASRNVATELSSFCNEKLHENVSLFISEVHLRCVNQALLVRTLL